MTMKVWDVKTGRCLMSIKHDNSVHSVSFNAKDNMLITTFSNKMRIINLKPLQLIISIKRKSSLKQAVLIGCLAEIKKLRSQAEKKKLFTRDPVKTVSYYDSLKDLVGLKGKGKLKLIPLEDVVFDLDKHQHFKKTADLLPKEIIDIFDDCVKES